MTEGIPPLRLAVFLLVLAPLFVVGYFVNFLIFAQAVGLATVGLLLELVYEIRDLNPAKNKKDLKVEARN